MPLWLTVTFLSAFAVTWFLPGHLSAQVVCNETEGAITVTIDGNPLLTYRKSVQEPPEGMEGVYRRSGYIHPVFTPKGVQVTGDFPADHPHQHALFFAWRSATFESRKLDFWNQKAQLGNVRHEKVVSTVNGYQSAAFTVQLVHEDITAPDGPKPVFRETWKISAYADHSFLLEQSQTNISDAPLVVDEYRYGGMAIRGPDSWLLDTESANLLRSWEKAKKKDPKAPAPELDRPGDFLTSDGLTAANGNHSRPDWVAMHGVDAGIAVVPDPSNFRHPQPVRLHPSKPYFCFAPMVLGEFTIAPGETYSASYRYLPFDGKPDPEALQKFAEQSSQTP